LKKEKKVWQGPICLENPMNNTGAAKTPHRHCCRSSEGGNLLATKLAPHSLSRSGCAAAQLSARGPSQELWACSNGPQFLLLANCIYLYLLFGIKWYYLFPMFLLQFWYYLFPMFGTDLEMLQLYFLYFFKIYQTFSQKIASSDKLQRG
jgi:hypothetical protein